MKLQDRWQVRYFAALAAAGVGLLLRLLLTRWVGPGFPTYISFYPTVMVTALFFGFWPGIVATLASAFLVDYFVLPPEGAFKYNSPVDLVGQLFFVGMGVLMSMVAGRLRYIRRNLEHLVAERTASMEIEIDVRKKAETAVRKNAEDLDRSNKDLEQFAYVASHDLQEPLRAVAGFMGLLKKQYSDALDAEAKEYIDFAVDGAVRMQTLIHDLLAFSRVGTKGGAFSPFPMKNAVDAALVNLHAAIAESGAHVEYGDLPVVSADPSQMTQLLQNLIGNAVKFKSERPPRIVISAKSENEATVFSVADNGIGIDAKYFDRIFLIFQRLHTRDEYDGTGIGLAVCKKIVERHGGSIWVESRPGEGATFYFSIPTRGENS